MSDFEIRGTEDLLRLSKALKAAGRTGLRKELHRSIRAAARPLIPKARAAALASLPQRGGLGKRVASSPMRAQFLTGRNPGVRIGVGKGRSAWATNHGEVQHPVFGNRGKWVSQRVDADWFDGTMRRNAPAVRPEVARAMDRVIHDIIKGRR